MLQFITNTESKTGVVTQIKEVIAGGGKWIQIRMKDALDEQIRKVVEEVMPLCIEKEVFLLLDDRVELAKELNVGGVHLGKSDMPASKARVTLGAATVIGVTANTFQDVEAIRHLDIDYIGLGPFRYTTTKKNLSPTLGPDGLAGIVSAMKRVGIIIPTVAVGGITLNDVENIMLTGVNGIAVSGDIANADDIASQTALYLAKLENKI